MIKDKITLKKVISKLDNMNDSHKVKWVYSIISTLNDEFIHQLFNETYEQGKFDGARLSKVEKVKIPDYIANWLDYSKSKNVDFRRSFILDSISLYNYVRQSDLPKLQEWFKQSDNQVTFMDAWLNGYEIEKTKYYYVAIPIGRNIYNRLSITSSGTVYLDKHNYCSLDTLMRHSRQSTYKLTEEDIKKSPLSWAWKFAKVLEE